MRFSNLIDTKQIAELLGLSREWVTDNVTKRPTFPKPVINVSQRTRKWDMTEVLKWAKEAT